ncbi:hypothetical protein MPSEU_000831800 [Mayamaea pseudoterrestris]|nr:hypothetical protein MPSEU_000831800 [Mayamaea pseudoterrestris]
MSASIDKESEDIFAQEQEEEEEHDDESLSDDEDEDDDHHHFDQDSARKAAAALTSLVGSRVENVASNSKTIKADAAFTIPMRFTKSGRKRAVPFPMKLMKVLTEESNSDIISWTPSGKSFVVHKPKLFVAQILGRVFKSAKYSSFTRKLHRWGFMRHYRGEESGSFYHELFVKDRLDLCEQMTCHKVETSAPKSHVAMKRTKPAMIAPNAKEVVTLHRSMHQSLTPRSSMTGATSMTSPGLVMQRPPMVSFDMPVAAPPTMQQLPNVSADLNAAIEMEVSRRLKERINQAALSRQALLVMQQQEEKARQEQQLRYQLSMVMQQQQQYQQHQHHHQQMQAHQQRQQQLAMGPNMTAGLVRHLAALKFGPPSGNGAFNKNMAASPHNFPQAFASNGLPPTNIQGAKTA